MSDSCYDPKDRDRIRLKAARGILHFGASTLNRKGDPIDSRPVEKEEHKPVAVSTKKEKKGETQQTGEGNEVKAPAPPIALDPSDMIEMTQK